MIAAQYLIGVGILLAVIVVAGYLTSVSDIRHSLKAEQ